MDVLISAICNASNEEQLERVLVLLKELIQYLILSNINNIDAYCIFKTHCSRYIRYYLKLFKDFCKRYRYELKRDDLIEESHKYSYLYVINMKKDDDFVMKCDKEANNIIELLNKDVNSSEYLSPEYISPYFNNDVKIDIPDGTLALIMDI